MEGTSSPQCTCFQVDSHRIYLLWRIWGGEENLFYTYWSNYGPRIPNLVDRTFCFYASWPGVQGRFEHGHIQCQHKPCKLASHGMALTCSCELNQTQGCQLILPPEKLRPIIISLAIWVGLNWTVLMMGVRLSYAFEVH
jgi:hypothetical protein